jgi:hypothetical protein
MAPRQQPEHNSTAACASDAGAAMAARAQQHGGVRFCRAPRQPVARSNQKNDEWFLKWETFIGRKKYFKFFLANQPGLLPALAKCAH